jgi:hypothetical protein
LAKSSESDFGQDAIDALVKRMEDDRHRLIVIVAGYTLEMEEFVEANPGLRSRFNTYVEFQNFTAPQLMDILNRLVEANQYNLTSEAQKKLLQIFETHLKKIDRSFGNGRHVRNLFERMLRNQAMRLSEKGDNITREQLMELTDGDVAE